MEGLFQRCPLPGVIEQGFFRRCPLPGVIGKDFFQRCSLIKVIGKGFGGNYPLFRVARLLVGWGWSWSGWVFLTWSCCGDSPISERSYQICHVAWLLQAGNISWNYIYFAEVCSLRFLGRGGGGCLGVGKVGNPGWRVGFGSTHLAPNPLTLIRSV